METPRPYFWFSGSRPAAEKAGGRLELIAVAAHFPQRPRGADADFVQVGIDGVGGKAPQDHVGGGVVAEHDHEMDHVAEGQLDAIGDFAAQDARSGHFFSRGDGQRLGPASLSAGHRVKNGEQDGQLDGAGGANRSSLTNANRNPGIQILGVEGYRAREVADPRAEGFRQRLGSGGSGQDKGQEGAHEIDDRRRRGALAMFRDRDRLRAPT